jgi:RNA polymerase sigma factor (sigma-70 family)
VGVLAVVAVEMSEWRPDLDSEPDEELVTLAQGGNEAAFDAIVRRYEPELHAQARRLTSDGRAEDVVQQAFLNAFSSLQSGGRVRHLRGWLHQIVRNEVMRSRTPVEAPLQDESISGEALEDVVQRRATARAVLTELSALPQRQRDAMVDTALLGVPRAQIARTMGLSEGAVRQLVHRARLTLRQAATALVPFPLTRLFGGIGADSAPELTAAAGAASAGGLTLKVGALIASGALATGIAVTHVTSHSHPRPVTGATRHQPGLAGTSPSLRITRPAARATGAVIPASAADRQATLLRDVDRHGAGSGRGDGRGRSEGRPEDGAGRQGSGRGSDHGRGGSGGGSASHGGSSDGASGSGGPSSSGAPASSGGRSSGDGATSGSGDRSGTGGGAGSGDPTGGSSSGSGSGRSASGSSPGSSGSGSGAESGGATSGSTAASGTGGDADTTEEPGGSDSADTDPVTATTPAASTPAPSGAGTADTDTTADGGHRGGSGQSTGSGSAQQNSGGHRDLSGSGDSSSS